MHLRDRPKPPTDHEPSLRYNLKCLQVPQGAHGSVSTYLKYLMYHGGIA